MLFTRLWSPGEGVKSGAVVQSNNSLLGGGVGSVIPVVSWTTLLYDKAARQWANILRKKKKKKLTKTKQICSVGGRTHSSEQET